MGDLGNMFGGMAEMDKKAFKDAEKIRSKSEAERRLVDKTNSAGSWLTMETVEAHEWENEDLLQKINEAELYKEDSASEYSKKENTRWKLSKNLAEIVVEDTKWYGEGSDEMVHVQASTIVLFNLLETVMEEVDIKPIELFKRISEQYDEAINACKFYESKKNPWFPTGKRRKKMVTDLRTQLEIQRNQFNSIYPVYDPDLIEATQPFDLLLIAADESYEAYDRTLAKDEKRMGEFMDFEALPMEEISKYKGNEGKEEEIKKQEEALEKDLSDLKNYMTDLETQNKSYDYRNIPMPKHQKAVAERSAAKASMEMLKQNIRMEGKNAGLNLYEYDDEAEETKTRLKAAYDNKQKLIDDALNGDYAYYNDLKDKKDANKRDVITKSKLDDKAILHVLLKDGDEYAEHNKAVIDAVFTKGLAYDNLGAEKLKPYLSGAVTDFLKVNVSAKMLDDKYFPNHATELMSFFRQADMFNRFYMGYKEEKLQVRSPFYIYYMNSIPPQVRGLIERKVQMAKPLFELFKLKCEEKGVALKDIGADSINHYIADFSSAHLRIQRSNYTTEEKKESAEAQFKEYEKEYLENAEVFAESTLFTDKVKYVKNLDENAGNLFLADDLARIKALKKRVRGEDDDGVEKPNFVYNMAGLQKDIEDTEHVLKSILFAKISKDDFKDLDRIYSLSTYAYNKQLIRLVNSGGDFIDEYEAMLSMKGAKCTLNKDDLRKVRERINEIKQFEKLYNILDSVVMDPLFNYVEFKDMIKMSPRQRRAKINEASDDIGGSELIEYYSKVERLIAETKDIIDLKRRMGFFERLMGTGNA